MAEENQLLKFWQPYVDLVLFYLMHIINWIAVASASLFRLSLSWLYSFTILSIYILHEVFVESSWNEIHYEMYFYIVMFQSDTVVGY